MTIADSKIIATYDYKDEDGVLLYQDCRFEPKTFRLRKPDGNGDYTWNLDGVRRVLYRLPELTNAPIQDFVCVTEGEVDADRLAALGFTATTSGSSTSWKPEFADNFTGRLVCIIPDNDPSGKRYAETIADSLDGVAAEVKLLKLPGLTDSGDVSDWLDNGGTAEKLTALIDQAQPRGIRLALTCIEDIEPEQLTWFWHNKIPSGALTILAGDPDAGKSYLSLYLASKVSVGGRFPDCPTTPTKKGSVILVNDEDNPAKIIRPRLDILKANLKKIHILGGEFLNINLHLEEIEALVNKLGDCRLLIIDPITAYLGSVNANSNAEVRSSITPLITIAERYDITIIGVNHFNKKQDLKFIYRGLGSTAFTALSRSAWGIVRDKDERETRIFCPIKANYCIEPTGLKFRIIEGEIIFEAEPWTDHIDDSGQQTTKRVDEASNWLRERLGMGDVSSAAIFEEGKEQGFSQGLLYRAKKQLEIKASKIGYESENAQWFWSMPDKDDTDE